MGPIEFIGAAAKGTAKFASKHTTLTVLGGAAALSGGIVAYNNSGEADRTANGGAFMKQDVAKSDKNGDLSIRMQGSKDAPKAAEPAKSEAKSGNDEILKKLQEATKDAGIMAETAKETPTAVQEAPKPEKPYIPEQMKEDETSTNVLDGNGSNVFRPARFASSESGSATSERSNAGNATTGGNATKAVSGTNASAKSATAAGSGVKSAVGTSEATTSGRTEIAKTGGDKGGETGNKGGDGSKTETGKGTLSDNNNSSESKGSTANSPSDGGEPLSEKTTVVTPTTAVDDTVTVAAPTKQRPEWELEKEKYLSRERELNAANAKEKEKQEAEEKQRRLREEEQRRLREEKRNALRQQYLRDLKNAFEKEADCDVDDVVSPSDRERAGITSNDVMRLAARPDMRTKKVTLYVDNNDGTFFYLIPLLKSRRKNRKRTQPEPELLTAERPPLFGWQRND